jgi:hypothetical protein
MNRSKLSSTGWLWRDFPAIDPDFEGQSAESLHALPQSPQGLAGRPAPANFTRFPTRPRRSPPKHHPMVDVQLDVNVVSGN